MCGIIGYAGSRPAFPIVVESLKRLEYRGYDSAGVAVLDGNGPLQVRKTAGKIADLPLAGLDHAGVTAIAHTRWATHGKPTLHNAHPHTDGSGKVAVVHNGIVENYEALRASLLREGRVFRSETDTEVIPLLIERFLERGASLEEAVRETAKLLEGGHAIAVIGVDAPNVVIGLRVGHAGGLVGRARQRRELPRQRPPRHRRRRGSRRLPRRRRDGGRDARGRGLLRSQGPPHREGMAGGTARSHRRRPRGPTSISCSRKSWSNPSRW